MYVFSDREHKRVARGVEGTHDPYTAIERIKSVGDDEEEDE